MQGCKQRRLELIVVVIAGLALSVAPVVCAKPVWRCSGRAVLADGTIVEGSVQGIDPNGVGKATIVEAKFTTDRNGNGIPENTITQTKVAKGGPSVTLIMEDRNEDGFAEKQTLIEVHDLNGNFRLDDQDLKTIERWEDKNGDKEFDVSEKTISSKGGTDLFIPEDEEIIVSAADGLSDDATASLDSGDPLTAAIAEYLGGSLYALAMDMVNAGFSLARASYHIDEVTTEAIEMEIVELSLVSREAITVEIKDTSSFYGVSVTIDPPHDFIRWETGRVAQGVDLSDIVFAEAFTVGLDAVFVMELNDDVPYPATFIPGVSELEYFFAFCLLAGFEEWPWYSPVFDGLDCVPNAFVILVYAEESWRFGFDYAEWEQMQTIPLPEENLQVENNWLIMTFPLELFGESPGFIRWLAGTYVDGIADIAPNEGAGSLKLESE